MIVETARAFSDALPDGGMLIGLDPGTKTVGVALCDAGWRFATAGNMRLVFLLSIELKVPATQCTHS